jgi:peptide/nickel transport system substrate-binding protein
MLMFAGLVAWSGGQQPGEEEAVVGVAGKYGEAPMLAELVAKGELPPVEERLPKDPKVVEMIEDVGRYGGELIVYATTDNIFNQDLQGMWGSSVFRAPRNGQWIEPDLAEGWEIDDEKMSITIFLREGAKWSDGVPISSEDVRFTYENMHFDTNVGTWGAIGGAITSVTVIDDLTVKLNTTGGLMTVPYSLSDWFGGYATTVHPAHYLKNWHIDFNDKAGEIAKEEGFDNWYDAMREHYWWAPLKDPDKPQFEPWHLVDFSSTAKLLERNPYFWRVDAEGNQLPYIDRVRVQVVDPEVYNLKVSGGEASIAYYNTQFEDISVYKSNEKVGDFKVTLYPGVMSSNVKIILGGMFHADPVIKEVFNEISFRRGLSVAVNRDEINDVIYQGLGVPGKVAPLSSVSFYKKGWREDWAQYDPALANKLLDEAGLDKKDADGWRLLPDGRKFNFIIEYTAARHTGELELVKEYFEDVGVSTILKVQAGAIMEERANARQVMATTHNNPNQPWSFERNMYVNTWVWGAAGREWNIWEDDHREALESQLEPGEMLPARWRFVEKSGLEDTYNQLGEVPPDWWNEAMTLEDQWQGSEMGSPEYTDMGRRLFEFYVEEFFEHIGLVGEVPSILIAKTKLGNVIKPGWQVGAPLDHQTVQTWMDQLYWKE